MANRIMIDGREINGRTVVIRNGAVSIDGKPVDGTLSGVVEIRVLEGSIENLQSDCGIQCGDVSGNVTAGMSVTCGDVEGNVSSNMSVNCGNVSGSVSAGMSVSQRK